MKPIFKKLVSLGLVLCTAFSLATFAACGGSDDEGGGSVIDGPGGSQNGNEDTDSAKTVYTVTISCEQNSTIAKGFTVQLKKADGSVAAEAQPGADGKVSFTLEKGDYSVNLIALEQFKDMIMSNYSYPQMQVTATKPNVTVQVVPIEDTVDPVTYTLTVLLPNGSPAANLDVQLCGGPKGMCNPARTGADGKVVYHLAAGEYEVHIDTPPAGSKFNNAQYKMTEESNTLTITLSAA